VMGWRAFDVRSWFLALLLPAAVPACGQAPPPIHLNMVGGRGATVCFLAIAASD
jgi:hypothetical protein